jgi:BirA family biotin operon repressor/biotin-[acetyl-CoA-carboxylase] ligase
MRWPAEAIWEAVSPQWPDFTVEVLPQIASTNSELMRRVRAGRCEPTLLVAEQQTAGRGRLGRDWHSQVGDSLTFSVSLPLAPADWAGLSLAVGVSVAESLHPDIQLKWPNDLWLQGRKLAGVLIETAGAGDQRSVVVGVGINIAPRASEGLSTPPACLQELLPDVDAGAALLRVAPPLLQALAAFQLAGLAPFLPGFARRDLLCGNAVTLSNGTVGMARGIDAQGGLLLQTPAGMQTVTSSEVSVRPAAPATPGSTGA